MLVFRLEHPEYGNGPFSFGGDTFEQWMDDPRWDAFNEARGLASWDLPSPWDDNQEDDVAPGIKEGEKCACDCPELLFDWFGNGWTEFDAIDFAVAVYEVDPYHVRHGQYQSVAFMSDPIYVPMEDFPY